MKLIKSWIQILLVKYQDNIPKKAPVCLTTQTNTKNNIDFYKNYYSLIADGVRLKLIEPMFSLNLFALFEKKTTVLERDIIETLGLMPIRAKKWLHLLCCEHFLIKVKSNNLPAYELPEAFIQLMLSDEWWGMKFFFNTWMVAAEENLTDVLRFGKPKISVSWPPKTDNEVIWLEDWMTQTAEQPATCLLKEINFKKVKSLLDIGGGNGTMACSFVSAHPHLKATVYNLPKSAEIARKYIESKKMSKRVSVLEGDFIEEDAFPVGFDLLLFTRVLFDWDESVSNKLLRMAYLALPKNGLVGICEFYKEASNDKCLASEYRYIFHDDFSPNVMKTAAQYRSMLEKIGFTIIPTNQEKEKPATNCSLILAKK